MFSVLPVLHFLVIIHFLVLVLFFVSFSFSLTVKTLETPLVAVKDLRMI